MKKSILMSIRPEWVAKILNGEKTVEARKRFPKDYHGWIYIYCTKRKPTLKGLITKSWYGLGGYFDYEKLNGKVVARFYCELVEVIDNEEYGYSDYEEEMFDWYFTKTLNAEELQEKSCLKRFEIANYLQREIGYAIHISQLEIFDKPKELSEFAVHKTLGCEGCCEYCENQKCRLTKAPQSYMFIETGE